MKTKWQLYILWSVLSLGLLSCALDTYDTLLSRRKVFKLGTQKSKPIKLSAGDRKSSQRLPASTSPLSQLTSQRPYPALAPVTPRSMRPGKPRAKIQSDFAYLPDVSVTCSTSDFVVRVKPSFYGLGADAEELKLGSTCKSNGVLRPYGDLLFTYPLTACESVRQSPRGYLIYKYMLHYEPSPKRFPSRAHRIDVDIECRYQRNLQVYQLTVKPTWQTAVVRKRLKGSPNDFQIQLMDDSWSGPAKSKVYPLGKTVNFHVSALHLPTGVKLYISGCYATPSSGSTSSLKYTIIDNLGCMLDSKREPGASRFISRTDKTIRFSLKAFQFTSDPDTEVNIHCKLFGTSEDPGPAHKSCTYRGNRWNALTGDDSICKCCDSQCVTSKTQRAMMEGFASSRPLLVSDEPYPAEDGFLPISHDELHSHDKLWGSEDVVMDNDEDDDEDDDDDDEDEDDDEEQQGHTEEEKEEDEGKSGIFLGVMTEPDLEELDIRDRVLLEEKNESEVKDSYQLEEDGSGYILKDLSESEEEEGFEGREEEISVVQAIHSNQKQGEVLVRTSEVSLQRELQPLVSEGEEENREQTGRRDKDDKMVEWKNGDEDLVDDREMTWYFTWR